MKRMFSFILSISIVFSIVAIPACADSLDSVDLESIYNTIDSIVAWKNSDSGSSDIVITEDLIENAGTSVMDWFAFSAARMGRNEDFASYACELEEYINNGSTEVVGDYQRISLTILACGGDISQNGLLDKVVFESFNNENLDEKLVNQLIYTLLVLDSVRYEIPDEINLSRSEIIAHIMSFQLSNGAFAFSGQTPDTDITCMAIQALTPYYNSTEKFTYLQGDSTKTATVREVVDSAIEYLSSIQLDDGNIPTWGNATCESTAQAIVALCGLGIDPSLDERFVKNGKSLIDGLMKFSMTDGGFAHVLTDSEGVSNGLASAEAFYALTAYCRYKNGYRNLYDMREEPSAELSVKIDSLVRDISNIESSDTATVEKLLNDYSEIPLGERSYVYNFYVLDDILNTNGIENTAGYTCDEIGTENSGCGAVVDITAEKTLLKESGDSLGELDSTYSKLETSSATPQSQNELGTMGTVVVIAIGVAAVVVIFLNHKLNPKPKR